MSTEAGGHDRAPKLRRPAYRARSCLCRWSSIGFGHLSPPESSLSSPRRSRISSTDTSVGQYVSLIHKSLKRRIKFQQQIRRIHTETDLGVEDVRGDQSGADGGKRWGFAGDERARRRLARRIDST